MPMPEETVVYDASCSPCCGNDCCQCADLSQYLTVDYGIGSFSIEKGACVDGESVSYVAAVSQVFCGDEWAAIGLSCSDGVWILGASGATGGTPDITIEFDWDGDCSTVLLTGSSGGCSVTITE